MIFSEEVYSKRLIRLSHAIADSSTDVLIINGGADLAYCTGITAHSHERLLWLLVFASSHSTEIAPTPILVLPRLEYKLFRDSPVVNIVEAVQWVDGDNPVDIVSDIIGEKSRVSVTPSCLARHIIPLADTLAFPVQLGNEVNQLRITKDTAEIQALIEAGEAIDRVHTNIPNFLSPGLTEKQVAELITHEIISQGHLTAEFVIVGSGAHGADPHHGYSDRVLTRGDIIVIDIGGTMPSGYYSDCTRMYSLGEPEATVAECIDHLCHAQQQAVAAVRPHLQAQEIDAIARDSLAQWDLDKYFIHRLGHGIGLEVHEAPDIAANNTYEIEVGNAFSIEPGIYFPGQWGARIEDIVIVTDHGVVLANNTPRELCIIE